MSDHNTMQVVNRNELHKQFQSVLDKAQAEVEALQDKLKDTIDDDGQSNQAWVGEVAQALKHSLSEASHLVWD